MISDGKKADMNTEEILSRMNIKTKIELCSGEDFWHTKAHTYYGIPSFQASDGPHGLRKQDGLADMLGVNRSDPATCFPTASTSGCSWDPALLAEIGEAIGEEAAAYEIGLVLGPGVSIRRDPLCGRSFEYFSEDPYLSGRLGAGYVRGMQKNGIGACLKHFACNSQEYKRFSSDSQIDERTLREIYLTSFEIAVKEGKPRAVMSAYNKINGVYCSDNHELLTDILRNEWGFDGLVVTDWGGLHDRIEAFRAGCDLSMPGGSGYMESEACDAVREGELPEACVDDSAARVIRFAKNAEKALENRAPFRVEEHAALARRAAAESAVLLKNENDVLPVAPDKKVGLFGAMAQIFRYQGNGSSHIHPTRIISPRDAAPKLPYAPGCRADGETTPELIEQAGRLAAAVEVPVIFAGLPESRESEGFDRDDMKMPAGHIELINAVSEVNKNAVVVLLTGSVVETPWADRVSAIVYMGLAGQAGGEAIYDVLSGRVNPSGKLSQSWPLVYEDCATSAYYGAGHKNAQYREGVYVGYRYFDTADVPVRWPFGFGLSYTDFELYGYKVTSDEVRVTIRNTGKSAGAEVVQIYVSPPDGTTGRPVQELRGFQKVFLQPGESRELVFPLNSRSFAYWNDGWTVAPGEYTVRCGTGSRDLPLSAKVFVYGTGEQPSGLPKWYERPVGLPSKEDWENLMGRFVPEPVLLKGTFDKSNSLMELKDYSVYLKGMYYVVRYLLGKRYQGKSDISDPTFRMMLESSTDCSLSSMVINAGLNRELLELTLEMANGRSFGNALKIVFKLAAVYREML